MKTDSLLRTVWLLAAFTVVYNVAEGIISVFFGAEDESLSLFGFGVDSFVEVISGLGIAHMVWRMRKERNPLLDRRDEFEAGALRVTGIGFYTLAAGLVAAAVYGIWIAHRPVTTLPGLVVSLVSIASMWFLMKAKQRAGRELGSGAVLADANCTKTCLQLSFVLLAASGLYELLRIPYVDAAGSLGVAWLSFREGREAFEKARTGRGCGCSSCGNQDV